MQHSFSSALENIPLNGFADTEKYGKNMQPDEKLLHWSLADIFSNQKLSIKFMAVVLRELSINL